MRRMDSGIIQYLKAKWKIVTTSLALIVAVAAGLVSLKDAKEVIWPWFSAEENISVIQARLQPFRIRPDIKEGQDEVFLMMEVRNYGTSPLMIVSADVDGSGTKLVTQGKAGSWSRCTFSSDANKNKPLTVAAGQTVWVTVGGAVLLKGLNDLMNGLDLEEIHTLPPEAGIGIHEVYFVDILNKALEKKYGKNAEIVANLYTGPEKTKHTFSFHLMQGKDLFSKDGSLQHDWLLAKWIRPGYDADPEMSKDCESKL
ncbi:hypothetical protein DOX48_05110 [Cronobacter malonaticus]|nr:hypothetical protein [Cronobacter malonaticus]EGT4312854.1 hypothetical protein [Cronobacter malonaticus]